MNIQEGEKREYSGVTPRTWRNMAGLLAISRTADHTKVTENRRMVQ